MLQKERWPFFLATRNVLAIVVIINVLKRHVMLIRITISLDNKAAVSSGDRINSCGQTGNQVNFERKGLSRHEYTQLPADFSGNVNALSHSLLYYIPDDASGYR